ncbi:hypothetical protein DB41_HI00070 [Neochlamydia sp. TUME1]|nr:hypothetical protein DB41_HI00070 [Neochlamydia sp. TUME1]
MSMISPSSSYVAEVRRVSFAEQKLEKVSRQIGNHRKDNTLERSQWLKAVKHPTSEVRAARIEKISTPSQVPSEKFIQSIKAHLERVKNKITHFIKIKQRNIPEVFYPPSSTLSAQKLKPMTSAKNPLIAIRAELEQLDNLKEQLLSLNLGGQNLKLVERVSKKIDELKLLYAQCKQLESQEISDKSGAGNKKLEGIYLKIFRKRNDIIVLMQPLKISAWAIKYFDGEINEYKEVGLGKAKRVWITNSLDPSPHAFFTPVGSENGFTLKSYFKKAEIAEEVKTAKDIKNSLFKATLHPLIAQSFDSANAAKIVDGVLKKYINLAAFSEALSNQSEIKKYFIEEIKMSMEQATILLDKLSLEQWDNLGANLAVEMEEVAASKRINGAYTVKTFKATRDLEKEIRTVRDSLDQIIETPTPDQFQDDFKNRALLARGFLKGVKDLHAAGYVHGDLKPENILVYTQPKEEGMVKEVKLSDFGKTQKIKDNEEKIHTGNQRFAAVEGKISKKAEVYSSALVLIRILEEGLLQSDLMIHPPTTRKSSGHSSLNLRGVERFLVENAACPQVKAVGLKAKVKLLGRLLSKPSKSASAAAQHEVHGYIDALIAKMKEKELADEKKLTALGDLLKSMTLTNTQDRLTMEQVLTRYERLEI